MDPATPAPPVAPSLVLGIGVLAVSASSIFIRFAQEDANSLVIAAYRLTLASLALAPFVLRRNSSELRELSRRSLGLGLLSGVFLALHFATWIQSLAYTTVASSVVLVTTASLWVALLAALLLNEPLTAPVLLGLGIATVGGATIGLGDACAWQAGALDCPPLADFLSGSAFFGDLLALAGAFTAAGYLLIGRSLRAATSLMTYLFLVYGMAALVLVAWVLVLELPLVGYPPRTYLWFVLLALLPQLVGHSSFNWALRYLPAAFVSITLLGEPVGSAILAFLVLGETPGWITAIGAILILTGIFLASRRRRASRERPGKRANAG